MNPFTYSNNNKRYYTLAYHNEAIKSKSQKAVIDAGLTCPNIDGAKGSGGCAFCSGGSGYFTGGGISVREQIEAETKRIRAKWPSVGITAYFQAHTNTYCSAEKLGELLVEAAECAGVTGLAVATRPDCLDEEKAEVLADFARRLPLTVELGLQTVHDLTAESFNRCYSYEDFLVSYRLLKKYRLRVCVHLINGLMGENKAMMVQTAETVGKLRPDGVKIHLLHVIRGTPMAKLYESGAYIPLSLEEYVDIVISQLEVLPPETVIERVTGDGDKDTLLAPLWSRDKIRVLGAIDKEMAARNTVQGNLYLAES